MTTCPVCCCIRSEPERTHYWPLCDIIDQVYPGWSKLGSGQIDPNGTTVEHFKYQLCVHFVSKSHRFVEFWANPTQFWTSYDIHGVKTAEVSDSH